jgi:hypothetical protein
MDQDLAILERLSEFDGGPTTVEPPAADDDS